MPKIKIDNIETDVDSGLTVLQACESIGVEIPRFCYHERLSIAGNCRMCLVEMENSPKPVASCAMPVAEGMVIKTKSELVKKARKGVMEFLLINHPLDCPICDQGGECDLQDQAMAFGKGFSRFDESKRAVKNKNLGPLIKTHMTRCIHCTRCVRFIEEVAGTEQLGLLGRGEESEISSFLEKTIDTELSGNIIDLCPVGALTSKPYAFIARPWELKKTDSIDLMDAVGSNVRFDTKANKIMRVLPRVNDEINEEWISDKARFAYDGLLSQRLQSGYVRKNNKLVKISNNEIADIVAEKVNKTDKKKIAGLIGNTLDCENIFAFKLFLEKIECNNFECRQDNSFFIPGDRTSYLFNSKIVGVDDCDLCFLIGCDLKKEAPIINARLRKKYKNSDKNFVIANLGEKFDDNLNLLQLGENPKLLTDLLNEKHLFFKKLKSSKKPLFIIGQSAMCREDSKDIFNITKKIYEKYCNDTEWNGFNVLQNFSGRTGALDIGFVSKTNTSNTNFENDFLKKDIDLLYVFGADDFDFSKISEKTFVIYHGHHGDRTAQKANIIIPCPCFTEQEGIYINTEGRPQISAQLSTPLPKVNFAWRFFLEVSKKLNMDMKFSNFIELRKLLFSSFPHFEKIDFIKTSNFTKSKKFHENLIDDNFVPTIKNYYMTDSVSRLSVVMADCSRNKQLR
tara:strand:+ start:5737 stop:7779 length:2043 start_codon:yes stop_codon:yes gene_type:complete